MNPNKTEGAVGLIFNKSRRHFRQSNLRPIPDTFKSNYLSMGHQLRNCFSSGTIREVSRVNPNIPCAIISPVDKWNCGHLHLISRPRPSWLLWLACKCRCSWSLSYIAGPDSAYQPARYQLRINQSAGFHLVEEHDVIYVPGPPATTGVLRVSFVSMHYLLDAGDVENDGRRH